MQEGSDLAIKAHRYDSIEHPTHIYHWKISRCNQIDYIKIINGRTLPFGTGREGDHSQLCKELNGAEHQPPHMRSDKLSLSSHMSRPCNKEDNLG